MIIRLFLMLFLCVPTHANLCENLSQVSPDEFLRLEKVYEEMADIAFEEAADIISTGDKDAALKHMKDGAYEQRMLFRCVPENIKREALLLRGLRSKEITNEECHEWAPKLRIQGIVCK
jgi:hypothetical protein